MNDQTGSVDVVENPTVRYTLRSFSEVGHSGRACWTFFSVLALLTASTALCSSPQASLRVYNNRGTVAYEIPAEESFRIELSVPGDTGKHGWPQIPGLPIDCIRGRQQRHEVSWNKGKQSGVLCFSWEVVMRTPDSYRLGPLRYTLDDGTTFDVASVTIKIVGARDAPSQGHTSLSFMRWEIKRLDPFAGELVPIKLVFYTTDEVELEAMSEVKSDKALIELSSQATQGTALHNGISYTTVSWEGTLQASAAGAFSLPVVGLAYKKIQKSTASSPWAIMQHMLGAFSPSQQLRSSPLSLNVRALPPSDKQIVGVGVITEAERNLSSEELSQGGALTVTYRLKGSMNFAHSLFPPCLCEGEGVTTYGQKTKVSGAYPSYTGEQEYVIHVQKAGPVLFPQEEIWFFNPYTEQYESVIIPEASLKVIPRDLDEGQDAHTIQNLNASEVSQQEVVVTTTPQTMQSTDALQAILEPQIPFRFFLFLLILPLILLLLRAVSDQMLRRLYRRLRLSWVVWHTKRSFMRAVRAQDGYHIHTILSRFLHELGWVAKCGTLGDTVYRSLEDTHSSHARAQEWKLFWALVERAAFARITSAEYRELERVGTRWVDRLSNLLNTRC